MYAVIESGSYDDYDFNFVEFDKADKENLVNFIKDLDYVYGEYNVLAFVNDIEIHDAENMKYHLTSINNMKTELVDEQLERISKMGVRHWLYKRENKREKLQEMLNYNFI